MTTDPVLDGRWRTPADSNQPVQVVLAEAMGMSLCLRDEEAAGSNPATPTQVTGHSPRRDVAFSMPYSSKVQQRLRAKLPPEPLERVECLGVRERPFTGDGPA